MAREASTPPVLFRTAMTELGRWLTYEAIRDWLPTQDVSVQSPLAPAQGRLIRSDIPLAIVPILRAGLALLPGMQDVLPAAAIYHLGMVRDETSLDPSCYLNKLPDQFPPDLHLMISEPMLATGGTLDQTLQLLTQRGLTPDRLRIISIIAAPPALQRLNDKYSGLVIYSATIDEGLDDRGFILPGLGDAGDRSFGT